MKHAVTGENVPDPSDQIPIYRYINPRSAEWQEADYIVSNPPFLGNKRIRDVLGDGYAVSLRETYKNVSETVDYVMYWWHKAAELVRRTNTNRFGFITTNSIRQSWQSCTIDFHLNQKSPLKLIFAIPDHPWVNEGAAVRIAMTVAEKDDKSQVNSIVYVGTVINEKSFETPEDGADQIQIHLNQYSKINSNLHPGIDISKVLKLKSNSLIAGRGVCLHGAGFLVSQEEIEIWGHEYLGTTIKLFGTGKSLVQSSPQRFVIDFYSLSVSKAAEYTKPFQKVIEEVKPERDVNKRETRKQNWWLFGENMPSVRQSIDGVGRYSHCHIG